MITTGAIAALSSQVPGFTAGPGWNLVADVQDMLSFAFMRNAFAAGTASAIVAGLIGYFVVLRGSSFAAHAISHIGFAGAAGAVLLGLSPVLGVAVLSLAASAGMGVLGKRLRGRDVVIGLIMAASLGLGYLFISLYTGNAQNAYSILFGQIFGITTGAVLITIATSGVVLALFTAVYRPLLFASLDEEVAQARGIPVGAIGIGFMLLMALAVSEAVQVSGVLLIFALLVAPGAIAERIARRPATALAVSGCLAVLITWASLTLAYYTPYPVSFYVTSLAFAGYIAARAWSAWAGRPLSRRGEPPVYKPPGQGHRDAGMRTGGTATVRV
jgi:zinc/manganese transport system permease protein